MTLINICSHERLEVKAEADPMDPAATRVRVNVYRGDQPTAVFWGQDIEIRSTKEEHEHDIGE